MASICTDRGGLRRISFVDAQGRRRSLRLGRMSKKDVEWMLPRVEALIDCTKSTRPPSPELLKWIAELPPKTQQKLKALGLIDAASMTVTLGELVEKFMALQDVKPATLAAYRQTTGSLMDVLGKGTPIVKITTADADRWRKAQASSGLAGATVAKRTIVAKNIFNRAVHWKMISSNPFAHLKSGNQRNPDRIHYVDKAAIDALLEVCPDNQWKAIIALARYAGLRCPSEILKLRWEDVDWKKRALTVRSPKTERHVGHEVRVVPIDQVNLRGILAALYAESSGKGPVVPCLQRGFTGHGPHRDELRLEREGRELRSYGSQGEQRLALLSLLLAEREALAESRGRPPILLLDDVMSELDASRREMLVDRVTRAGQTVITTTDLAHVPLEGVVDALSVSVEGAQIVDRQAAR